MENSLVAIRNNQPNVTRGFKAFRGTRADVKKIASFMDRKEHATARVVQYGNDPRDRRVVVNYSRTIAR